MTKILITGALYPDCIKRLQQNPSYQVLYHPDVDRDKLLSLVENVQVLVTRSETNVDQEVIDRGKELKLIARAAVGIGNIDLETATQRGILVINTPGKNTNSAAELTMALMLSMLRNIPQAHSKVKQGGWDRHTFTGEELRDKAIGIVGLGNVGHRVARFAHGFDMHVFAYDPYLAPQLFARYQVNKCETLNDLLAQVDILSVHVPLNKETRNMVAAKELAKMRPGSFVINAARGGVINEQDLLTALSQNIAGAAIDTWEQEPLPLQELVTHDKVWVSPHIGASTIQAQKAIGFTVVDQIEKALSGGVVDFPVNLAHIGSVQDPLIQPYAVLAEKLGSLAAQLIHFNASEVHIAYRGDLAEKEHGLIRLSLMKGFASKAIEGYVSHVNAQFHFEKLGIQCIESIDPEFESYRSALKISFRHESGKELIIGGIVFDQQYLRISLIDHFYFEVEPNGNFLVVNNLDKPGVIGDIGKELARHQINIDSFDLSRDKRGGKAMALIKIDEPASELLCERLASYPNIIKVDSVCF